MNARFKKSNSCADNLIPTLNDGNVDLHLRINAFD